MAMRLNPQNQLSGDIPHFAQVCKNNHTVVFNKLFYVGYDGCNNIVEPKILCGFGVTPFWVIDIWWVETPKGTLFECVFPSVPLA